MIPIYARRFFTSEAFTKFCDNYPGELKIRTVRKEPPFRTHYEALLGKFLVAIFYT